MVEKQFGTILEVDHCYTCLLQKFLSLLLKVFHFGNKFLCHLEGFCSCVDSSDGLKFDLCGEKKDWTGHHSRLRVFRRGKKMNIHKIKGTQELQFFHKGELRMICTTNFFLILQQKPSGQAMEVLATWQVIIFS